MTDDQFPILFIMAIIFMVANDYIAFAVWYILYKESITITWMTWDQWTIIFMIFYVAIRMLAVRMGWQSKSRILGGEK